MSREGGGEWWKVDRDGYKQVLEINVGSLVPSAVLPTQKINDRNEAKIVAGSFLGLDS